jgi:urease accessory protein
MNFMPARQTNLPTAQRANGRLRLAFKSTCHATRIAEFYQEGCLKTRLPTPVDPQTAEAITMNISGGIAGGDSLATEITLHPHARVTIASATAERIYRALADPSRITTRLTLHERSHAEYLPQETILFNGFALARTLDITLHPTATFLGLESLIFGRHAMGETIRSGRLSDKITLHRGEKLIFQDITHLTGDIAAHLTRPAIANGATATATLIYAAPDAPSRLAALRQALAPLNAGATLLEDVIFARLLAPTGASLRHSIYAALAALRGHTPLPKVWQG